MVSSFNITKLKELLKSFYTLSNIRITVFDENFQEIVAYPEHIPRFCSLIRNSGEGLQHCHDCDKSACLKVKERHDVYIYRCHAGLTESIAPITLGEITIGYLLFGHIAPEQDMEKGWEIVRNCCKDYKVDMTQLKSAYEERRYFSNAYIEAASELMNVVASYLCVSRLATLKLDSLPFQLDKYIQNHLTEDLSSAILCEKFQLSRTKLYKISMENFGVSITEYIRRLRIQEATRLLETTALPINQIAASVGISDYNYFTKVFKQMMGCTPREYKRRMTATSKIEKK